MRDRNHTLDDELTEWEEMLTDDVNANDHSHNSDMGGVRDQWRSNPEDAPEGATENLRRMEDYESLYPDRAEAQNAGVIRTVAGALDPRTFQRKSIWAGVILVLLAGILIPFAISAQMAIWVGASTPWAIVVGIVVTLGYWKFL